MNNISRRNLTKTTAWSVPAITAAIATPAFAGSKPVGLGSITPSSTGPSSYTGATAVFNFGAKPSSAGTLKITAYDMSSEQPISQYITVPNNSTTVTAPWTLYSFTEGCWTINNETGTVLDTTYYVTVSYNGIGNYWDFYNLGTSPC